MYMWRYWLVPSIIHVYFPCCVALTGSLDYPCKFLCALQGAILTTMLATRNFSSKYAASVARCLGRPAVASLLSSTHHPVWLASRRSCLLSIVNQSTLDISPSLSLLYSQQAPHSLPVRASYGVLAWSATSGLLRVTFVVIVLYALMCYD